VPRNDAAIAGCLGSWPVTHGIAPGQRIHSDAGFSFKHLGF